MKIKQLIKELKQYSPEDEVQVMYHKSGSMEDGTDIRGYQSIYGVKKDTEEIRVTTLNSPKWTKKKIKVVRIISY